MNRFIGTKSPKVWLSGLAFVLNCGATTLADQSQKQEREMKSVHPATADE